MRLTLFIAALAFSALTLAQTFEGAITFKMIQKGDTTTNVYNVKGNTIKLDQMGKKSGKVEGSFVFDLAGKTVKFANPTRKIWGLQKNDVPPVIKGSIKVDKTTNTKTFLKKYKCTEYIVSDPDEDTKISYWVYTPDEKGTKFDFFAPMVELWNRKDKASIYFRQIKDLPQGSMPMMSTETKMDGKMVGKLEMLKIEQKKVDDAALAIPADYKKFEQ
jgi:hypothetical protein